MTPSRLVAAAGQLLDHGGVTTGWRPVAVAALARQALEAAIDDFWSRALRVSKGRPVKSNSCACYANESTSELAAITWVSLSGACHVRAYDLAPSQNELSRWLADTDLVIVGLATSA